MVSPEFPRSFHGVSPEFPWGFPGVSLGFPRSLSGMPGPHEAGPVWAIEAGPQAEEDRCLRPSLFRDPPVPSLHPHPSPSPHPSPPLSPLSRQQAAAVRATDQVRSRASFAAAAAAAAAAATAAAAAAAGRNGDGPCQGACAREGVGVPACAAVRSGRIGPAAALLHKTGSCPRSDEQSRACARGRACCVQGRRGWEMVGVGGLRIGPARFYADQSGPFRCGPARPIQMRTGPAYFDADRSGPF